jgi:polyphosphate kinase 2 (PPK2 family)
VKYWFSVSDEEQEARFRDRTKDPTKRWKLSPMDLESREKWQDYSRAKDRMLAYSDSDTDKARWYIVNSDDKKRTRLNCIAHPITQVPYDDVVPEKIELASRKPEKRRPEYFRPPLSSQNFVPELY